MFCTNCGNKIPESAIFCGNCGSRIEKSNEILASDIPVYPGHYIDEAQETKKQARKGFLAAVICLIVAIGSIAVIGVYLVSGSGGDRTTPVPQTAPAPHAPTPAPAYVPVHELVGRWVVRNPQQGSFRVLWITNFENPIEFFEGGRGYWERSDVGDFSWRVRDGVLTIEWGGIFSFDPLRYEIRDESLFIVNRRVSEAEWELVRLE